MRFALGTAALHAHFTHGWSRHLASTAFSPLLADGASHGSEDGIFGNGDSLTVRFGGAEVVFPIVAQDEFGAAYLAVRELFSRFTAEAASHLAFYGAMSATDDCAVVCIGPPGTGKTILALHLALAGLTFCGDEIFLLNSDGAVASVPRLPALRESCLPLLPAALRAAVEGASNVAERAYGRLWYALTPADLGGITPDVSPRPLRAIVLLEGRAEEPRLRPLGTDTMLAALMQRAFIRSTQLRDLAHVARAVRGARGFSLIAGEPGATAALVAQAVAQCR